MMRCCFGYALARRAHLDGHEAWMGWLLVCDCRGEEMDVLIVDRDALAGELMGHDGIEASRYGDLSPHACGSRSRRACGICEILLGLPSGSRGGSPCFCLASRRALAGAGSLIWVFVRRGLRGRAVGLWVRRV